MRVIMAFVLGFVVSGTAFASEYTAQGKMIPDGYDGPMFTTEDAVVVVAAVGTVAAMTMHDPGALMAAGPLAVLSWGAWRTNKYRPSFVAQAIRFNLAQQVPPKAYPVGAFAWAQ